MSADTERRGAAGAPEDDDELAAANRDADAAQRRNAFDAEQVGFVHVFH